MDEQHFELTEDLKQKIVNLGELKYPPEKCANVLTLYGENRHKFIKALLDQTSEIYQLYQMGSDLADFNIDTKLYQLAKTGDAKSIDMLEYRQKKYFK